MFRDWVLEHGYPRGLRNGRGYCLCCKDGDGDPTEDTMMVQKGRGEILRVPYLLGYMCRIPYGKVIYTGSLVGLLAWLEGGSCRPVQSHKRERGDVGCFGGGAVPIALEVSAQNENLMRKRLR